MSSSPRNWRDTVWLAWFVVNIFIILCSDAVPHYPEWLYKPEGSPLHFLQLMRDMYLGVYNDPFVQAEAVPRWMHPLFRIEVFFQLPAAVYAIYRLKGKAGTTGRLELLLLCYAFECAQSTLLCVNDIFYWDPVEYPQRVKNEYFFIYGPWLLIPTLMMADMYWRLYSRLGSGSSTTKKTQ